MIVQAVVMADCFAAKYNFPKQQYPISIDRVEKQKKKNISLETNRGAITKTKNTKEEEGKRENIIIMSLEGRRGLIVKKVLSGDGQELSFLS